MSRSRRFLTVVLFPSALLVCVAVAQDTDRDTDPVDDATGNTRAAFEERRRTQQRLDDWADEKSDLERRYHTAAADVAWLERQRDLQGRRLSSLDDRLAELRRRLAEADRLESSMQDTLLVIFAQLEEAVDTSLPFLPTERRTRLDALRTELDRPDVDAAEKLRRVLEALQIEAAYAGTVEVYRDEIDVDGEPIHADILRLGRLALFWRSPDGDRVGHYDPASGAWRSLPGGAARRINLAMETATRTRPAEVLPLPLGRITAAPGGAP